MTEIQILALTHQVVIQISKYFLGILWQVILWLPVYELHFTGTVLLIVYLGGIIRCYDLGRSMQFSPLPFQLSKWLR